MRIIFNLQAAPPADNGGTATIFNSANVLSGMGHDVSVVSDGENLLTWFKLQARYLKTDGLVADYNDAHALIATGAHSVQHVLNAPATKGAKFWWVRAHESWSTPNEKLDEYYGNPYLQLLVNSVGLQRCIKKRTGRNSTIVRPGMDFDRFYALKKRTWKPKKTWVLGALFSAKSRKRFQWVREIYAACLARKFPVKLHLFGVEKKPRDVKCDKYLRAPSTDKLREFYNKVDIWLASTKSEGLHMPPQEAMLCGCLLSGAVDPLSGMEDYLVDGKTGFAMKYWSDAVELIGRVTSNPEAFAHIAEAGKRKIMELGGREQNMEVMLSCLKNGKRPDVLRRRVLDLRRRGIRQ